MNAGSLSNTDASNLFKMYRQYHDINRDLSSCYSDFLVEDFQSVDDCPFDWKHLNVKVPIKKIEEIAKKTGVIQLRPVNPADRILIVACGNKPLANSGGYPFCDKEEAEEYHFRHTHKGAVTIDPFLAMNPTIVAFFGMHHFPMIEDGQFDLIVIEGTKISDTAEGRKELNRLLSKNGKVCSIYDGTDLRKFSWKKNNEISSEKDFILPLKVGNIADHPSFSNSATADHCPIQ